VKTRVLITETLSSRAVHIFGERGIEVDQRIGLVADELKAAIGAYDGLAIRSATKVNNEIISAATNLKVIGRAGIGGRQRRRAGPRPRAGSS